MALARRALSADIYSNSCTAPVKEPECFNAGCGPMVGMTICFKGGARWLLTKALIPLTYQHEQPPFEARQVFECTCICDPNDKYGGIRDAIIKIKYQIKGHEGILQYYAQNLADCQLALNIASRPEDRKQRLVHLEHAQELQYQATHALEIPHHHTANEIIALRHLRKLNCASTPQFLDNAAYWLTPDIDDQCMEGGYMIAVLMTRVPGKQVSYDMFWNLKDKAGRDEIREAFKIALLELWACRVNPNDCALRNIMWDEDSHKCYIVDFEDWDTVNVPDPEAWWNYHPRWRDWWLAEECGPNLLAVSCEQDKRWE